MGCCNINCFDYDYASPPLTVAIAVAPQQAPQQAPVEAPQQGPQQGPQPASVPAPSTVAAAAGRNETKLPAAADAAPSMFTQQPVGAPGAMESKLLSKQACSPCSCSGKLQRQSRRTFKPRGCESTSCAYKLVCCPAGMTAKSSSMKNADKLEPSVSSL